MTEEIFGPLLPIFTYTDLNEPIDFILSRDKPLAAYFFGNHKGANFKRFEHEVSAGSIGVNEVVMQVSNEYMPFGGVGNAGYGRLNGEHAFRQFSNSKGMLVKAPADYFPFNALMPLPTD